ncbi:MAG: multicopper oxidase domain-containing protein [Deltaproteobacteria bacterium]|nr:multicopper oxidase domain-containing protein [Deltaproteobacteria bacterium]
MTLIAPSLAFARGGGKGSSFRRGHGHGHHGGGKTLHYYIQAEEVDWDYAPWYPGPNPIFGTDQDLLGENVFLSSSQGIGDTYKKAVYREYTKNFGKLKDRPAYLGTLGPIIYAEVGDTIKVHLRNATSINVSIHPHGVKYAKDSEGAFYADGTSGRDAADDIVIPGGEHTSTWEVPERAGPGPNDPSSVVWVYHSHTPNVVAEIQAGLSGVLVITKEGMAKTGADGRPHPKDVDREIVTLWAVFDENRSMYIDYNARKYCGHPTCGLSEEDFEESNLMHSINGLLWTDDDDEGEPMYRVNQGEKVRLYIGALGSEVDLHTPHLHGVTLVDHGGHRTDVPEVLAGAFKVYDMTADNAGEWIYHCHIEDHVAAGMATNMTIDP